MSADTDEMQTLRLSRRAALTLRGAFNIVDQLLEDYDLAERYPITHGQDELFARMNRRLDRKLEQQRATEFEAGFIREPLLAAEAQAVRDAAGVLLDLLQSEQGREFLTGIGWLSSPDQPVDETEIEHLEQAQNSLDPTGVRPENAEDNASERLEELIDQYGANSVWIGFKEEMGLPLSHIDRINSIVELLGERRFQQRIEQAGADLGSSGTSTSEPFAEPAAPSVININRSIEENIVDAGEQIANAELPWPGFQDTQTALELVASNYGGPDDVDCDEVLKNLVMVTKLAVASARRLDRAPGRGWVGNLPVWLDDAYTALMVDVETGHCVSSNAQDTLWARIDEVMNSATPGASTAITDAGQNLLNDLRSVADEPTDFTREEGGDERLLRHVTELRASLEDRLDDPITTEDELQEEIIEIRPPSDAGCSDLLVSLAELAVIAGRLQVFLGPDVPGRQSHELTGRVAHERRLLLDRMGFKRQAVDEPLPVPQRECFQDDTLTALRNDFMSIMDPLEDDPDDVETRAYAVMSDIRNAFQDPRRGP